MLLCFDLGTFYSMIMQLSRIVVLEFAELKLIQLYKTMYVQKWCYKSAEMVLQKKRQKNRKKNAVARGPAH